MPRKPAFGKRLREVMEDRNVSIAYLAVRIPAHPVSISKWRSGHLPAAARLARLAGLLGVTATWLREGTGSKEAGHDELEVLAAQQEFREAYGLAALEIARFVEAGTPLPPGDAYTLLRRLFEKGMEAIGRPKLANHEAMAEAGRPRGR